jgi:outer membrane protein assembly factor BamB
MWSIRPALRLQISKSEKRNVMNKLGQIPLIVFLFSCIAISAAETQATKQDGIVINVDHPAGTAEWDSFGYLPSGGRYNNVESILGLSNVKSMAQEFKFDTGGYVNSSPAVANGTVYFGSYDGNVYAIDAGTGALIWQFSSPQSYFYSSPAVANGIVYIGGGDNYMHAIDASTGVSIWEFQILHSAIVSSPVVVNGIVYFGSTDSSIYALNAATGALEWQFVTGKSVLSSPAVANGIVYIGSEDGNLYALSASTGTAIWTLPTGNALGDSSPAVSGNVVYFGAFGNPEGILYALDASTGAILWQSMTSSSIDSTPAVANGLVYITSYDGYVYAFNSTSGALKWKHQCNCARSSPAVANGVLYVGSIDNHLYALNASTGAALKTFATLYQIFSSPAVVNGTVYVGSDDRGMYAFGLTVSGPKSISFPNQLVGITSSGVTVTLKNASQAPATISNVTIIGTDSSEFSQNNTCTVVPAQGRCSFQVFFTPAAIGKRSAMVQVSIVGHAPLTVSASGSGTYIGLSPSPLVFGIVSVGSSSSLVVTATNNNPTATVQFKSAILSGPNATDFTGMLQSNCLSVAPGGVCSINVTFHPSAAGQRSAILTVKDSDKSVQTESVSGTGQ